MKVKCLSSFAVHQILSTDGFSANLPFEECNYCNSFQQCLVHVGPGASLWTIIKECPQSMVKVRYYIHLTPYKTHTKQITDTNTMHLAKIIYVNYLHFPH